MKLQVATILLFIFSLNYTIATENSAECEYLDSRKGYFCQLKLENSKATEVTQIMGQHLSGKSDDDVVMVKV